MKLIITTLMPTLALVGCDNATPPAQRPTQKVGVVILKSQPLAAEIYAVAFCSLNSHLRAILLQHFFHRLSGFRNP